MPNAQQYEAFDPKTGQHWDWDGKTWNIRQPQSPKDAINIAVSKYPKVAAANRNFGLGIEKSFGLTPKDPNDPNSLSYSDAFNQLVSGLKKAGITSLKHYGPLAPADLIAKAIEGTATNVEEGAKTAYKGYKVNSPDDIYRGLGELFGGVGQTLGGAEGEKPSTAAARTKGVNIAGREYPALKSELQAEPGVRGNLEQGMKRSFVGGPLKKVGAAQQSFARNLISDIASKNSGVPSEPEAFVDTVYKSAEKMRKDSVSQYDSIVKDLSGGATTGAEEIGPARKTAGSIEEAQRNAQNANAASIKAFGKPYLSMPEDERASIRDMLGITEDDFSGPSQQVSTMKGNPKTGAGAGVMLSSLMKERANLSDDARAAYRSNPPDFSRYRELQNQIKTTEGRMDDLVRSQNKPELMNKYATAKALTGQSYAMRQFGDTMDSVTKGLNKMQQEGAGFKYRPQEIQASQMVEKMKDLGARLDQAVGPQDAQAIRQTAEMLRRAQGREGGGGFAHYATTYGPALVAIEELFRRGNPGGFVEAGAMYGGFYLVSKVLASKAGRTAMAGFLRAPKGSADAAAWMTRVLAVARQTATKKDNNAQNQETSKEQENQR